MAELLHKRGIEKLIPNSDRQALVDYAEKITQELPDACAACPAAYICALALNEDDSLSFPHTPTSVRHMDIRIGRSTRIMLSGQAQFALKAIVRDANERGTGPKGGGDRCCLDPVSVINVDESNM